MIAPTPGVLDQAASQLVADSRPMDGLQVAYVDRRHIKYRPPFSVETFTTGFVIGVDAGGLNCVRFRDGPPGHVGCDDLRLMSLAVDGLNRCSVSEVMETMIDGAARVHTVPATEQRSE